MDPRRAATPGASPQDLSVFPGRRSLGEDRLVYPQQEQEGLHEEVQGAGGDRQGQEGGTGGGGGKMKVIVGLYSFSHTENTLCCQIQDLRF